MNWASYTMCLKIIHYQTLQLFRSQWTHAETSTLLLGDAWQRKTHVSKIGWKYQTCLISDWIESMSEAKKSEFVTIIHYEIFCVNLSAVICRLALTLTTRLAPTCSDCKIGGAKIRESGQKSRSVFQALVFSVSKTRFQKGVPFSDQLFY